MAETVAAVFLVVLAVFWAVCDGQMMRGGGGPMRRRMRVENEEARRLCLFLPLENNDGRRLGTCCVFPGRHRRFFGMAVLARKPNRNEEENVPSSDEQPLLEPEERPPQQNSPSCEFHPLMLREHRVGVCCTFFGRFRGKPEETILPNAEEQNVTESTSSTTEKYTTTTLAVPLSFDTRDFINSSCKDGYVLNANYECVMMF